MSVVFPPGDSGKEGGLVPEGDWQNNSRMGIHEKHRFVENNIIINNFFTGFYSTWQSIRKYKFLIFLITIKISIL
jgi:hypothetical protein